MVAAATYDPGMDGEALVLFDRVACLASTIVFADGGVMEWSVGG